MPFTPIVPPVVVNNLLAIPSLSLFFSLKEYEDAEKARQESLPAFTAELYKCRRRERDCILVKIYKNVHFFYKIGYTSCSQCEDKMVCYNVHGRSPSHSKLISKNTHFDFQILLFNEKKLSEKFTVGRFVFERKINVV